MKVVELKSIFHRAIYCSAVPLSWEINKVLGYIDSCEVLVI
jgi:hypothetical protein